MIRRFGKLLIQISNNKSSKKIRLNFGKRHIFFAIYKKPTIKTIGITNETKDLYYVPFVDYDNININKVIDEAKKLIDLFELSGLCLICSYQKVSDDDMVYGNYHLIGLDKMTYETHRALLDETCCDRNFKRVPEFFRYKHWVLRIYPKFNEKNWEILKDKPKFICWIKKADVGNEWEQSKAHYEFLRKYYNIPKLKLNFDNNTKLNIIKYNTTSG